MTDQNQIQWFMTKMIAMREIQLVLSGFALHLASQFGQLHCTTGSFVQYAG